jgi:NAD(P)H-hydrate epimerase
MLKVLAVETMRAAEAAADAGGLTYATMMDNAGRAAADEALDMIQGLEQPRVTVLVGAGNNGGDGLVAGRYIAKHDDVEVRFYLLKHRDSSQDAVFKAVEDAGLFVAYFEDDRDGRVLRNMVASADLVLDALFGIGIRLPIEGNAARLLRNANQALNARRSFIPDDRTVHPARPMREPHTAVTRVLAIDCPSGLNCDTGELDPNAIHADQTITFIAAKPGLMTFPGATAVGHLSVATIDVPPDLEALKASQHELATAAGTRALLPKREINSHKGSYGKTLIVGGSVNYSGAAGLCAASAYRAGAGLVTVAAPPGVVNALSGRYAEPTWLMLAHDMGVISETAAGFLLERVADFKAMLIGPGIGQEETTQNLLKRLLEKPEKPVRRMIGFGTNHEDEADPKAEKAQDKLPPLVIDADGLNILARVNEWWNLLPEDTIITPHPGEMSRLSGMETKVLLENRMQIAQEKAAAWQVVLVLKGAHTLIAAPDGRLTTLPFKTDALATAGTGDVLGGIIAGLLAQGAAPYEAAVAGGYIHGLAGTLAALRLGSGRAVVAGDVIDHIPEAFQLIEGDLVAS